MRVIFKATRAVGAYVGYYKGLKLRITEEDNPIICDDEKGKFLLGVGSGVFSVLKRTAVKPKAAPKVKSKVGKKGTEK